VLKVAVGADRCQVTGRTVREAFDNAFVELPRLRQHILLADGALRPHVLCLVNGEVLRRNTFADHPLRDGDEILIHQAISGG
jgi:sulfur carrier protein ThiS